MDNTLSVPQGAFTLDRYPRLPRQPLRAWDAADEYVLQHLAENNLLDHAKNILVVNDEFGALTIPLASFQPHVYSDSYIACHCLHMNLRGNSVTDEEITFINSTEKLNVTYDVVIVKIPKSKALLEHQLFQLRHNISPETIVVSAAMVKHIHTSTLQLFERIIGPTTTSLARKKARLIFSQPQLERKIGQSPYPANYRLPEYDLKIHNHANVFAAKKLDIGTRFFLEQLPQDKEVETVVDLGCGNGLLGIIFARRNPQAHITFIDESYMAVDSARINFTRAFPASAPHNIDNATSATTTRSADFLVSDCLTAIDNNSIDLILNNPPFHQNNVVGDHIAWNMFKQAQAVLRNNGELWVIGNRHLGYHIKLKRLFGNCELVASNNKFVLLRAIKTA